VEGKGLTYVAKNQTNVQTRGENNCKDEERIVSTPPVQKGHKPSPPGGESLVRNGGLNLNPKDTAVQKKAFLTTRNPGG